MADVVEIKSSGSSGVTVPSDTVADVFGPWTAMFMGVDQATHPITFDSTWALLVLGDRGITISQFVGLRMDVEIGIGPTSPPAEIVWGPMRYAFQHTGGGRGNSANYSFPLVRSAGDQFWIRIKKDATAAAGVQDIIAGLTVWDGIQPIRPATEFFMTAGFFTEGFIGPVGSGTPAAPEGGGVIFPGFNVLGLWHITTPLGGLAFDSNWLSVNFNLNGVGTSLLRFQMGATPEGNPNPPDLPELIDVMFANSGSGGGGSQNSVTGDVYNFPIPWEKGQNVWVRGATLEPGVDRSAKIAMHFWGNP